MATTLDDVQEPQVAEKKIHWWHEELQRVHQGQARHPATQACQEHLTTLDGAMAACLEIISVASTQRFTPAETTEANEAELIRSYRARLALLAHALSDDPADLTLDTHPDIAALALAQHEQLLRLPSLIHRGLPVFSNELYQQFDTRPHDLAEHIRVSIATDANEDSLSSNKPQPPAKLNAIPVVLDKPGRQALLAFVIAQNHSTLTEAVDSEAAIARYRHSPLLPLWRLIVLRKYQLELWKKNQPDLLRERTTLTPLSKLFRAWQHRR